MSRDNFLIITSSILLIIAIITWQELFLWVPFLSVIGYMSPNDYEQKSKQLTVSTFRG